MAWKTKTTGKSVMGPNTFYSLLKQLDKNSVGKDEVDDGSSLSCPALSPEVPSSRKEAWQRKRERRTSLDSETLTHLQTGGPTSRT